MRSNRGGRINLESEYNNRQRVANYPEIAERWQTASEAFREASRASSELDISYGESERQQYDLFRPDGENAGDAPLIVYIHGGYWQRGDRKDYSCVAEPFVAAGCQVALPSYRLCPDVGVMDIVAEMCAFIPALYQKTGRRPLVVGHSAGGHLAAALLATDWASVGDVPEDLVTVAYAISGVFQLRPLTKTSLNDQINLSSSDADDASPMMWDPPPRGRLLVAAVGANESREFIRQSLELVGRWGQAGATAECVLVPDSDHFSVVDKLMTPGTGTFERVLSLAKAL